MSNSIIKSYSSLKKDMLDDFNKVKEYNSHNLQLILAMDNQREEYEKIIEKLQVVIMTLNLIK